MPKTANQLATPDNTRGMIDLLQGLGGNPARDGAQLLWSSKSDCLICTGFPVAGHPETDGPPGAAALAGALLDLGKRVWIASWPEVITLLQPWLPVLDFIDIASEANRSSLADRRRDYCATMIEVCSVTADGRYYNMRGTDISNQAPRFEDAIGTSCELAIGDGGNEFGMGAAPSAFFQKWGVIAPVTKAGILIPASVSNFGAYAVVAELSVLCGRDLLPASPGHIRMIEDMVDRGAVCGFTGKLIPQVDGRGLDETAEMLENLREWVSMQTS